jgi:ribosome modulation factor
MIVPYGFEKLNRALQGAYRKGYEARILGKKRHSCPYASGVLKNGRRTWSKSFRRMWREGWDMADRQGRLRFCPGCRLILDQEVIDYAQRINPPCPRCREHRLSEFQGSGVTA